LSPLFTPDLMMTMLLILSVLQSLYF
jgi:hypothetical protein